VVTGAARLAGATKGRRSRHKWRLPQASEPSPPRTTRCDARASNRGQGQFQGHSDAVRSPALRSRVHGGCSHSLDGNLPNLPTIAVPPNRGRVFHFQLRVMGKRGQTALSTIDLFQEWTYFEVGQSGPSPFSASDILAVCSRRYPEGAEISDLHQSLHPPRLIKTSEGHVRRTDGFCSQR
jgi:hypothetical protein